MPIVCEPFHYSLEVIDGSGKHYHCMWLFPNIDSAEKFVYLNYWLVCAAVEKGRKFPSRLSRKRYQISEINYPVWLQYLDWIDYYKRWLETQSVYFCPLLTQVRYINGFYNWTKRALSYYGLK
jgi:hypothetical protein